MAGPDDKLQAEANDRLKDARAQKAPWALDFRECYFFAAPQRQRWVTSETAPSLARIRDESELQTSQAFILTGDFVTEVVNTYMPEAQPWCERGRGMFVPEDVWKKIEKDVRKGDAAIFNAIKASNLYTEVAKGFDPDLAIGTVGLWIDRRGMHRPIHTVAIPLRELDVNLGPENDIDDRFHTKHTTNAKLPALLGPEITKGLPRDIREAIEKKPKEKTRVSWGFWRLWDREDDECWQHVVLLKDRLLHSTALKGEGSCPLIVGRFGPTADWPWGMGPLLKGLPDLRQVDELEGAKIENVDLSLRPPIAYPDDSFAAVEQGLETGMAYPVVPGRGQDIKKIYDVPPPDKAIYQSVEMLAALRKLFFVDFPEQSGDTPPTLGQWLDELARAQRRLGTPGLPFWREVCAPIFLRFKYLLEAAGTIAPIKVNGMAVSLTPMNPAQRAAEQQEITMAVQSMQIIGQLFPEEFKAWIDGKSTMDALLKKMRVTLVKFREQDQVDQAVGMISQLLKGKLPGVEAPVGAVPL